MFQEQLTSSGRASDFLSWREVTFTWVLAVDDPIRLMCFSVELVKPPKACTPQYRVCSDRSLYKLPLHRRLKIVAVRETARRTRRGFGAVVVLEDVGSLIRATDRRPYGRLDSGGWKLPLHSRRNTGFVNGLQRMCSIEEGGAV